MRDEGEEIREERWGRRDEGWEMRCEKGGWDEVWERRVRWGVRDEGRDWESELGSYLDLRLFLGTLEFCSCSDSLVNSDSWCNYEADVQNGSSDIIGCKDSKDIQIERLYTQIIGRAWKQGRTLRQFNPQWTHVKPVKVVQNDNAVLTVSQ